MPKKILLADDSITIQKVVELTFSDGDYEVIATNNGNKAIQKLAELRPDIILSDIIMPEKNGYELCEYVKSHPDYRHIPVVLLTGTFEPFDPDRAEKAGCDAVITKPFESQSLIHKVEELIEQSSAAPASVKETPAKETSTAPVAALSPEPPEQRAPVTPPLPPPPPAPAPSAFESHDVYGGPPSGTPPAFEEPPAYEGEARALPKMSFEDLPQPGSSFAESQEPEMDYSGATKAFPKMSFEDLKQMSAPEPAPAIPPEAAWSPPAEAAPASEWAEPEEPPAAERPSSFEMVEPGPSWSPPAEPATAPEPAWPAAPPVSPPATEARAAESLTPGKLSDEDVDRIARRVVELMSDQVVRNVAWEVIPDLAEMVVRERIRQLESES